MDLPKIGWSWKEGFQFALCWKLQAKDNSITYQMNIAEKWGMWIVSPLYKIVNWLSHHLRKPLVIVLLTLSLILFLGIAFYYIPVFIFLGKIFPPQFFRFLLFAYTEFLFFGIGCRALGRFYNLPLIILWKEKRLFATYPGDPSC